MTDDGSKGVSRLRGVFRQLEDAVEGAGGRVGKLVDDVEAKRRLSDAIVAIEDVLRRVRGKPAPTESPTASPTTAPATPPATSPATSPTTAPTTSPTTAPATPPTTSPTTSPTTGSTPLEELTVRELHRLAREREIPGRSSMNKAELINALSES